MKIAVANSKTRFMSALLAIVVIVSGLALGNAAPAQATETPEQTILRILNQDRADNGKGPLRANSAINTVARNWAYTMAAQGVMYHNPNFPQQIPSGWSRAGENVARGYQTPEAVQLAWMNSPGHRANILGDFTDVGIAFIRANGTTWGVQVFAKYGASVPAPPPVDAGSASRLSGGDRYETAVAISKEYDPGVNVVYIATGTNYPDALSAAPAAAKQGGPLLLTPPNDLPGVIADEIRRLSPQLIVVVGGESVVSARVYSALSALAPEIRRDGGSDRYETSRIIVERAFDSSENAYIATGANFPDALSASAAAGSEGAPVILVNGSASRTDSSTLALMESLGVNSVAIAGGTSVVSTGIESQLRSRPSIDSVVRYAGQDRYATSQRINAAAFGNAPKVYFATGTGFADALAGAALAAKDQAPLYVVPPTCVPSAVISALVNHEVEQRILLGGPGALSSGVANLSRC